MAFLAQLRLDEIKAAFPASRLPASGLLVVFADIEADTGAPNSAHVEVAPSEALRRMAWPPELAEEIRYEPSLAVAEPSLSVSDWPGLKAHASEGAVSKFRELIAQPGPDHRLFGHPSSIQGHGSPAGYELLLQLDSDPMTGMTFGDGGRLHVWCAIDARWSGEIANCEIDLDSY